MLVEPEIRPIVVDWRERAACRGKDTAMWFPGDDPYPIEAVETCRGCPVRVECGEYALGRERFGLWGGMSEADRRRTRRARARSGANVVPLWDDDL